jgi:hypothetical protein
MLCRRQASSSRLSEANARAFDLVLICGLGGQGCCVCFGSETESQCVPNALVLLHKIQCRLNGVSRKLPRHALAFPAMPLRNRLALAFLFGGLAGSSTLL